ncbi:SRPBCC family protein [Psychrobacillus sp. NEAU-3TGS]|uniref:SRPBCC family protein n=1 Tax=Psychrobacillus sp. NEAU-3TGS TaxID=2995412 RepID=UPI00249656D4|nr:SRPBCC family protein [Psychrobacillus sp. NEAU-3TGS]MDI2589024.1 SRPBCC family protein [Psychrobacillus sp. NEAU-3TGS]
MELKVPIEFAWPFFYGDLEKKKLIFPKVVGEEILESTEQVVGTVIHQTYQIGSLTEQYDITIRKYADESDYKMIQESFILNDRFQMTIDYELQRVDNKTTKFIYTSLNKPKNPLLSLFQLFGRDEVVVNFMNRTKDTIENAYKTTAD